MSNAQSCIHNFQCQKQQTRNSLFSEIFLELSLELLHSDRHSLPVRQAGELDIGHSGTKQDLQKRFYS